MKAESSLAGNWYGITKAGKHLHSALSHLHRLSHLVFCISQQTDLRYHQGGAPEEPARLETVFKSIQGDEGVPRKQRSSQGKETEKQITNCYA